MTMVDERPTFPMELTPLGEAWVEEMLATPLVPHRGKYIAIEGIDGSGKSTQAEILAQTLGAQLVREPGSTSFGEECRTIVKEGGPRSVIAEVFLFAAARADLLEGFVVPALTSGFHVVSDRSIFSSLAYQARDGVSMSLVEEINTSAPIIAENLPDLVIFLDISPELSSRRRGGDTDAMEASVRMEEVSANFRQLAAGREQLTRFSESANVPFVTVWVHEDDDVDRVARNILSVVTNYLDI